MDTVDLGVLRRAREWLSGGHEVVLYTVIETWGSAPRPVGSLLALRDDGRVEGSVSGGCIEDDLLANPPHHDPQQHCQIISYGLSKQESARFGLPCGGTLRLLREPLAIKGAAGQAITVISHLKGGCIVSIKDGRYTIDNQLAEAMTI